MSFLGVSWDQYTHNPKFYTHPIAKLLTDFPTVSYSKLQ